MLRSTDELVLRAETIVVLPYNDAGKFLTGEHKRGIKEYIEEALRRGVKPSDVGSVAVHMNMKRSDWDEVLSTNLTAAFVLCQAVLKPMIKQRSGRIVAISSIVGCSA